MSVTQELPQGEQITANEYHAAGGVSNSMLKVFLSDVRLYHYQYISGQYRRESKPHFDFGSAVHDIALLGSEADVVLIPDAVLSKSGSRAGKAWKEFEQEHLGKALLKQADYDAVRRCVDAMHSHPVASRLLSMDGMAEHSYWYDDADLELRLKCRPDKLCKLPAGGALVLDIKTTSSGTRAGSFAKQVANFRYHCQEAFYRKVLERCGIELTSFLFIAVDVNQPHCVDVYSLDRNFFRIGETQVENGLLELAEHHRSGQWTPKGYDSIVQLSPPNYLNYESEYEL